MQGEFANSLISASSADRTSLRRTALDQTCHCHASTTNCWNSSVCPLSCQRVRLKRLLPHCGPQRSGLFTPIALKLVRDPKQRTEDRGAVIPGQVHDTGFDDKAAEFDEMPRALAALDLP